MFWPQVVRGIAIMFCLLPPTRFALGSLPESEVADASGFFNLMRNLGGAIGIALIDTILYGRIVGYAENFRDRLLAGDVTAAQAIGLSTKLFLDRPAGPPDEATIAFVRPMVEKAALALCVNEAWAMLAGVAVIGLLLVPFARDSAKSRVLSSESKARTGCGVGTGSREENASEQEARGLRSDSTAKAL
jgi:MFS transporter, DHA2 family, multidrug resistance protein